MELYIIRHAQSVNNVLLDARERVVDPALTELGERQAELLAKHLAEGWQPVTWSPTPPGADVPTHGNMRGYGLTRLYCSPMLRSMQTIQPVARALGLTPEVWLEIHEQGGMFLDQGEGENAVQVAQPGMTRGEMLARFPDYVLPDSITERGWYMHGFEEWPICHERAGRVAATLRSWAMDGDDQRIAIVTHGGFADALLKALLRGSSASQNGHGSDYFYLHFNTAIDRLDLYSDGHLGVSYLNRVVHLPGEMIS